MSVFCGFRVGRGPTQALGSVQDPAVWWNLRHASTTTEATEMPQGKNVSPSEIPGLRRSTRYKAVSGLVAALKKCGQIRDLEGGKRIHRDAIEAGLQNDNYVAATLITMYGKCRRMALARQVFDRMDRRDVATWNSLMLGYVQNGESLVALDLFKSMDLRPDPISYVAAIKACGSLASEKASQKKLWLKMGITIHNQARERGYDADLFVASCLMDMYSKYGSMHRAREVFDRLVMKNVVIWNTLIQGYVQNGESSVAMDLFSSMDCEADSVTYIAALKACGALASENASKEFYLQRGISIHEKAIARGFDRDMFVASILVDMYSKCGKMDRAREVFDRMVSKDVITWTSLILGYVQNGECLVAVSLFSAMDRKPDLFTYVAVMKAYGGLASANESEKPLCLEKAASIHKQVIEYGFDSDTFVGNSLVDMYNKCSAMKQAREVFNDMVSKDVVSWNSLIFAYVQNGESLEAMDLFSQMDCEPDSFTYVAALKACGSLASEKEADKCCWLQKGIAIHKRVEDHGLIANGFVASSVVDMYSKCGSMEHAQEAFERMVYKDVVVWNSLILGYVQNGENLVALDLFSSMDCQPDTVTYLTALKACGGLASENESDAKLCLQKGVAIHKQVRECGLESDMHVANTLLDMYCKCRSMDQARQIFDTMVSRDVFTWTSLILGYVQTGQSLIALDLFTDMDCDPDFLTFVAALKACGSLAALSEGLQIHARLCKLGLEQEGAVMNTLVDLYGKCGSTNRAEELFINIHSPDLVSWNALIGGYTSVGDSFQVFRQAKKMQEAGIQMDGVTFISILTACSHRGLIEQGKSYFESMSRKGIKLTVEHYNCMVDMLGRANRLQEALALINRMPFEANTVTWQTLLAACKQWKNLEVGKVAFEALEAAGTAEAGAYMLMSGIYGSSSMRTELEKMGTGIRLNQVFNREARLNKSACGHRS